MRTGSPYFLAEAAAKSKVVPIQNPRVYLSSRHGYEMAHTTIVSINSEALVSIALGVRYDGIPLS